MTTYTVTVQNVDGGNKYFIDGSRQLVLNLTEGNIYHFDWSAVGSHPLRFSSTADGTHGGGSEYTSGVTVNGTTSTIIVPAGAPTLYYYCQHHHGMGGELTTEAAPSGNASGDPFVTPMFSF